jgi:hypothetical protein
VLLGKVTAILVVMKFLAIFGIMGRKRLQIIEHNGQRKRGCPRKIRRGGLLDESCVF